MKTISDRQAREVVGGVIRRRRLALGLKQAEYARAVGISPSMLCQTENGIGGSLGPYFLLRLALVLRTTPARILDEAFIPVYTERPE